MPDKIKIRKETQADYPEVFELNFSAFGQEDEAKLVDALRKNPAAYVPALSIVATMDNRVVGHILFTIAHIKDSGGNLHNCLALAPMAVKPGFQKSGIGGQLIKNGLKVAKDLGFSSVIVLGHEHYYPKFGFELAAKWNISPPFEVPENVFMAIELQPEGLKDISGTVIYPKEFDKV
jgi:putative acetyltransferase